MTIEQNALVSGLEPTYTGPPKRVPNKTLGKDQFLELLLVQMQNQDPLEPQDQTESIAQLAQFSSLEQMTNLNTSMETLLTAYEASNRSNSLSMIGKKVEGFNLIENDGGETEQIPVEGTVTGIDLTTTIPTIIVATEKGESRVPQNQIRTVQQLPTAAKNDDDPESLENLSDEQASEVLSQVEELLGQG